MPRGVTLAGQLAALGFADTARAQLLIEEELRLDLAADAELLEALGRAADPDLALASLARLADEAGLRAALRADQGLRDRLTSVLGASAALGDHLARHPADWQVLSGPGALRRPDAAELRELMLTAVGGQPGDPEPPATPAEPVQPAQPPEPSGPAGPDPATALRVAYRRQLLHLAGRDLTGAQQLDDVMAELADLAAAALEAALAIARAALPAEAAPCRLAVIAMGKCGARELNYASDVDVIFVAEPGHSGKGNGADEAAALRTASRLAAGLIGVCSQSTPEGALFPVDANLRPEGRSGPLVRTLNSHLAYYQRWAKTWEFQALLKARPAAGDLALGEQYLAAVAPLVWQSSQREGFVADVQAMRRRVVRSLPAATAGRELKLGPGGLRDIEFAVQLLQLVHGRTDDTLRAAGTLPALSALAAGGYVGRPDAAGLGAAYRFLRAAEHLLQLRQLRRTHTLPDDPAVLRRTGRALRRMRLGDGTGGTGSAPAGTGNAPAGNAPAGRTSRAATGAYGASVAAGSAAAAGLHADGTGTAPATLHSALATSGAGAAPGEPPREPARREPAGPEPAGPESADPAEWLTAQWRLHAAQARLLHEKLFYRPLLEAVARLPGEAARLTAEAARERLEALGYADPAGALRHLEALTAGMTRKAAIQRTLLPVMLGWFADAPEPDAGLLAFRQVSEALGDSPWYLRLLRDDMRVAQRMARLLASSRYATGLLMRAPEAVAMLADDAQLAPRLAAELEDEASAAVGRAADEAGQAHAADLGPVRALRRRELLRTAAADVLGMLGGTERADALSQIAAVTVGAALQTATGNSERLTGPLPTRLGVVAMGRFGGHEMGYASDADVLYVHDPLPGADEETAARAAHAVAEQMRALLAAPGPDPVLIADAGLRPEGRQGPLVRTLASYRAYYQRWSVAWEAQALLRAEPVAGDSGLGAAFAALADEIRYPDGGLAQPFVREIRRIKARMEAERMPRGAEPALHLKLGPGGLSDVEWVVQLLQLQHGHAVPALRTTRTLAALAAAAEAGLVSAPDAGVLREAWLLATSIRDASMLVRGRPSDTVPAGPADLAGVARLLGYPPGSAQELAQDYRRAARRARAVMERLFYG
ncbi:MAG TPA: bifunctional [glutamine synthetase] adenylyltransferase/[glutamine synthetase]-adenylyl-L-tyrosine phosphorylase [Streptosporangiaceae bacterium]